MKSPSGHAQPRRKAVAKKQVRLNLRRTPPPPAPEDEIERRQRGSFWKWFLLIALFHLVVFTLILLVYRPAPTPPPEQFISLVPQGETVKGTPGAPAAAKLGATTPAPVHHHLPKPEVPPEPVTPPPAPEAVEPPKPLVHPKPIIKEENAPALATAKPKPKPKPTPPKPKVKVDLHLADGPAPTPTPEKPKPKHLRKTPPPSAIAHEDDTDRDAPDSETSGLSKEQIAARLGKKLEEEGVTHAEKSGISGSADGHENSFSDFYASIHDQFMNKWQAPGTDDPNAAQPIIQIHVEKDGRVPPDRVVLLRSSGNAADDESALDAARSLGYLLQPLPDGCPPDITLNLKLTQ